VRGDPYVSGRHAEIHCDADGCVLVDVGSTNGTFLRGQRLIAGERHDLAAGDEVRLGQSVFRLEVVTSAEDAAVEDAAGAAPVEDAEAGTPAEPAESAEDER
jgi:pSer/pThr/pTyr-binding forkhead associated (FHA) protein